MNIYELVNKYVTAGYSEDDAIPKVAQDIVLLKIGNSKYSKNITVKGGVVMHNISKDMRRATRDMDIDFIKYSLEDKSILNFIKELNNTDDGVKIKVTGKIEPLHHQDYDGKRVYIQLTDKNKYSISSKLDIGVHKYFDMEQDEYCFDFNIIDESVSLLINSKEQIIVEKVFCWLRFGKQTTRYKEVFDIYYLISYSIDVKKVVKYFECYVFNNENFEEKNMKDVSDSLREILYSKRIYTNLKLKEYNCLNISGDVIIKKIINFFESI